MRRASVILAIGLPVWLAPVAIAFALTGADEDEQEARDEGHPGRQQRGDDGGSPGVERTRLAEGAEECDELHHHDQRSWSGLG